MLAVANIVRLGGITIERLTVKCTGRRRGVLTLVVAAVIGAVALPALADAGARAVKATIGTGDIKNGAVTNAKIRKGTLLYTAFKRGQVARANLAGIKAGGVLTGTYPRPSLAVGSVTASAIATGAVGSAELAAGAVGSAELAAGAVRASDIADGSIGPNKIAANSIGRDQLAKGGVGSSEIAAGAVGVSELAPLPGARAYRAAPISIASGVVTQIALTDTTYNRDGVWSTGQPAQMRAPVTGIYAVTGGVLFQNNGAGTRGIWIIPAGDPANPYTGEQQSAVNAGGQPSELNVSTILRLSAGEAVAIAVIQTSGEAIQVLGNGQRTCLGLQLLTP